MTITVIPFASVRDILQYSSRKIDLKDGSTVGDLLEALISEFPDLAGIRTTLLFAVNEEYATSDKLLRDGDEIALFPPVSGG